MRRVPGWLRARGLALYLSVFMGGIAVGSAGWVVVGDSIGSQGAFAWRARRRAHTVARSAVEPQLGQQCRPVPRSHVRTRNAVRTRGRDGTGTRHVADIVSLSHSEIVSPPVFMRTRATPDPAI